MAGPRPTDSSARFSDDELGSLAVAIAVGELHWTPDVAPAVMDRISRDAVAYPDQFDRRQAPAAEPPPLAEEQSLGRTIRRLMIFGAIAVVVAILVLLAATANAADLSGGGADAYARMLSSVTEVS
jgi:hypothetical protein